MNNVRNIAFIIIVILWLFLLVKTLLGSRVNKNKHDSTKTIVRIAIFGAIAALLYCVPFLKFPVPFFPSFLEFHFDEIPVFIAGFAYGPMSAIGVILVKTIIKLPFSTTLGVGELSDVIFSLAFVIPSSIIYKYKRNFKGALLGILVGLVFQLLVSLLGNIYVMVPFYMFMFNMTSEQLLAICRIANPNINDVTWTYGLLAVLPFNAIKDAAVIAVTMLVYKSTHRLIDRIN